MLGVRKLRDARSRVAANARIIAAVGPDALQDDDFRRLQSTVGDVTAPGLRDFYAEWLPRTSGVPGASVELDDSDLTHTEGTHVRLNVARPTFESASERLAAVHSFMWHEAAHVRHPIPNRWISRVYEREIGIGQRQLFAAFQSLEDLRIERELLLVRPQAAPWLAYILRSGGSIVQAARTCGSRSDCGWPLAATMFAGRAAAGVFDTKTLIQLRSSDTRLGAEIDALWLLWQGYMDLTDAQRDAGKGDHHLTELARVLPANV